MRVFDYLLASMGFLYIAVVFFGAIYAFMD